MPTYEYACRSCGHRFEIVQSFSEDALRTCPECEQEQLRKVYSAAGIIFKGDGWHIKDYGSTPKGDSPAATEESSGDGDSSDSPTTESPKQEPSSKDSSSSETASKESDSGSSSSDRAAS